MPITRRAMLGLLSSSTFFLTVNPGAVAVAQLHTNAPRLNFPQGVASGDPQPDAVMLWTRAVPPALAGEDKIPLLLQVSAHSDFSSILLQAQLETSADSDYTVRSHIDGLAPDTHYYYRFLGGNGSMSRTGRTRTAPSPEQGREVNLAFASCQSYEQAYYGSWARMLADDAAAPEHERIQFVLHLGDFVYERSWHTRSDGSVQSRQVPPFPDGVDGEENRYAISLADYRHLYHTYLSDPHLQEARARWPFICTWDDHEFANDNFQAFTTYGEQPRLEAQRKQSANQAWFEFIPAVLEELEGQPAHDFQPQTLSGDEAARNRAAVASLRIYRQLRWGKYLDILLTDNRSYRSAPCLPENFAASLGLPMNTVQMVEIADAGSAYANGNPPATLPIGDGSTANPDRERPPGSILGQPQRDWLLDSLKASDARWKLWGNSLPLIPLRLDMSSLPFAGYQDSIFNIDSWAGYPHEQRLLMKYLQEQEITGVVSLSGDHHMHGAGTVSWSTTEVGAQPVSVDFTVAGISSSSLFEELLSVAKADHPDFQPIVYAEEEGEIIPVWNMSMLYGVFAAYAYSKTGLGTLASWIAPNHANPGLKYVDTTANGYGLARFSEGELQVRMITMQDCRQPFEQAPKIRHVAQFRMDHWQAGETPVLQGPEFEGGAPFPFVSPTV
jgi:alkaline phosphatase D